MAAQVASRQGGISQQHRQYQQQQEQIPRYSPVRNYRTPLTKPFIDNPDYLPQQQQQQERPQRRHRRSCSMPDFIPEIIIPDTPYYAPAAQQQPSSSGNEFGSPLSFNYSPEYPPNHSPNNFPRISPSRYSPGPVSAPPVPSLPSIPSESAAEPAFKASTPPQAFSSKAVPPRRGRHVRHSSWSCNQAIVLDGQVDAAGLSSAVDDSAIYGGMSGSRTGTSGGAVLPRSRNALAIESQHVAEWPRRVSANPQRAPGFDGRRSPVTSLSPTKAAATSKSRPVPLKTPLPIPTSPTLGFATGGAANTDADADSDDEFVELYGNARRHRAEAARALNALERLVSSSATGGDAASTSAVPLAVASGTGVKLGTAALPPISCATVAQSPVPSPTGSPSDRRRRNVGPDAANPRSPLSSSSIRHTIFGQGSAGSPRQAPAGAGAPAPRSSLGQSASSTKSHYAPQPGSTWPLRSPSKALTNSQSAIVTRSTPAESASGVEGRKPHRTSSLSYDTVTMPSPVFAHGCWPSPDGDRLQRRRSHEDSRPYPLVAAELKPPRRVSFSSNVEFISEEV